MEAKREKKERTKEKRVYTSDIDESKERINKKFSSFPSSTLVLSTLAKQSEQRRRSSADTFLDRTLIFISTSLSD